MTKPNPKVYRTPIRKNPLYHNAKLEAPDGETLCTCDVRKADWYLKKGLGIKVSENPLIVRLKIEPSGRPVGESGAYYVGIKNNECVVCGAQESYCRKYIVPREYRKHFPSILRNHQSHDVLLMCVKCHGISNDHEFSLKRTLAIRCNAPIGEECDVKVFEDFDLKRVVSASRALLKNREFMPEDRIKELEDIVKGYYNETSLTQEDLENAAELNHTIPNTDYEPHGKKVVDYFVTKGMGIGSLEKLWRENFLSTMKPKFLPDLWSVNHQIERLKLQKLSKSD